MEQVIQEIVRRGLERGYVTYEQVNEMLPEGIGPDLVDLLLIQLEEKGIELVDADPADPDKPAAPVPLPRFHRLPEFARRVAARGVELTDCVCYVATNGEVSHGKIMVPGSQALEAWHSLRRHWPSFGFWPIISVYRWERNYRPDFVETEPPAGYVLVDWVDVARQQEKKEELIELANRCAPDPRTFHRWHYGALESLSEIELAELGNGPTIAESLLNN